MNAQAAVLDFQAPLKIKRPVSELKIHFCGNLDVAQKSILEDRYFRSLDNYKHEMKRHLLSQSFGETNWFYCEVARGYKREAEALIDTLRIVNAISEEESDRLSFLFAEQADLFDGVQAA